MQKRTGKKPALLFPVLTCEILSILGSLNQYEYKGSYIPSISLYNLHDRNCNKLESSTWCVCLKQIEQFVALDRYGLSTHSCTQMLVIRCFRQLPCCHFDYWLRTTDFVCGTHLPVSLLGTTLGCYSKQDKWTSGWASYLLQPDFRWPNLCNTSVNQASRRAFYSEFRNS